MSLQALLRRLEAVLVCKNRGSRSPHKPLYLLQCIARMQRQQPRLALFDHIEAELRSALQFFGPPSQQIHPEYPFWRLPNDGLAELVLPQGSESLGGKSDPSAHALRDTGARGGLLEPDHELLANDHAAQSIVVHKLLDAHFPRSIHEDVLAFFRLQLDDFHAGDRTGEHVFQKRVLEVYGHRCALTGFGLCSMGRTVGVEAAHVCWTQAGGNDSVSNGIAMTVLHRRLFHLGLFRISNDYKVKVSSTVLGGGSSLLALERLNGQPLLLPVHEEHWPASRLLEWHGRHVFKP